MQRLTQREYSFGRNYHIVTDYVYENGLLVQEIANYEEYRETWTVVTTYTYDADGNLLSESISSNNPNYSLSKEEYLCVYEDVYFYSAE